MPQRSKYLTCNDDIVDIQNWTWIASSLADVSHFSCLIIGNETDALIAQTHFIGLISLHPEDPGSLFVGHSLIIGYK